MDWLNFLKAIIEFLPYILDWLRKIFATVEGKLGAFPADPVLAVHDAFAAARGELYVWQYAKRRVLAACERVALRRAEEIAARAVGSGPPPVMTTAEYEAVGGASGLLG